MATSYTIDFTDKNINRSFQLAPYTTNGPQDPTSTVLDSKASSAATSLLLHGKGSTDYGERIQEDIIHVMENFAGTTEPSYPIGGQLWFDTTESTFNIRVYNTKKHELLASSDVTIFVIAGDQTARFVPTFRMRVININGGGEQEDYFVSSATFNGTNTEITVAPPTPSTSRVGWFIGGWEYIVQNNSPLHENLNANMYTIVGLRDLLPSDSDDVAANKGYVDNAIANSNELNELTDVNLTDPIAENEILTFDAVANLWRNRTSTEANLLNLTGGTMVGSIDMAGNDIIGLINPPPTSSSAASKSYVDDAITAASGGAVNILEDLTDVVYGGVQQTNDTLQFNGAVWTNIDKNTYISNMGLLKSTGDTMTGFLVLHDNPVLSLHAATKSYVDVEITNAISASGDGVVDGGYFDAFAQELTLTRTNGLPNVTIGGFAAGGSPSTGVIHTINDPLTNYPANQKSLYMEAVFGEDTTYPEVTLDTILKNMNQHLGDLIHRKQRVVLQTDGTPHVVFGDNSTYGDLPFTYVTGFNTLDVFVNGVKQMISEYGWLLVEGNVPGSPTVKTPMWQGYPTGLSAANTYYFRVDVNAGAANGSGIPTITVPVDGSLAQTMGQLINQINDFVDVPFGTAGSVYTDFNGLVPTEQPPFAVLMEEGSMQFFSGYPGTGSRIQITDGDGLGGLGLFANIHGGGLHLFDIDEVDTPDSVRNDGQLRVPSNILNPPAPITWAINEYGRVGRASEYLYFTDAASTPPVNSVMELTISPVLVYNRESQEVILP